MERETRRGGGASASTAWTSKRMVRCKQRIFDRILMLNRHVVDIIPVRRQERRTRMRTGLVLTQGSGCTAYSRCWGSVRCCSESIPTATGPPDSHPQHWLRLRVARPKCSNADRYQVKVKAQQGQILHQVEISTRLLKQAKLRLVSAVELMIFHIKQHPMLPIREHILQKRDHLQMSAPCLS